MIPCISFSMKYFFKEMSVSSINVADCSITDIPPNPSANAEAIMLTPLGRALEDDRYTAFVTSAKEVIITSAMVDFTHFLSNPINVENTEIIAIRLTQLSAVFFNDETKL